MLVTSFSPFGQRTWGGCWPSPTKSRGRTSRIGAALTSDTVAISSRAIGALVNRTVSVRASAGCPPAIDRDHGAGHLGPVRAEQKSDHSGHLIRIRGSGQQAPQSHPVVLPSTDFGLAGAPAQHWGVRRTGADAVDPHPVRP